MYRSRVVICVCLIAVLLSGVVGSAAAEYRTLPELLQFRQRAEAKDNTKTKVTVRRTYPETANAGVNAAVAEMVDRLAAEAETKLPTRAKQSALGDTTATVRVTGTQTASFLVLAHVSVNREQIYAAFETAVFNLQTGDRLTLDDLFDETADDVIREAVREQLTAYFAEETPDEAALGALADGIREAPFTLSPAYLILHYPASALYQDKVTLMHVKVPYRLLTASMTDYAVRELDNSAYRLAALTFDDGPGRGVTTSILNTLAEWCAVGTFFNVGKPMRNGHDYVAWEHDAGHAVQSHTYNHTDKLTDKATMFKEKERFAREQSAIIGIPPTYMRAPGGIDKLYCDYGIGMPIIRWSTLTGDASESKNVDYVANMVHTLKDSSIILMHNIRWTSVRAASTVLNRLYERGYMFVTVDELFEIRGIQMEENVVYYGDEADRQE